MTDQEMKERNYDWRKMSQVMAQNGISVTNHYPVKAQSSQYHPAIFASSQRVNELVNKGQRVFIFAGSGVSKAPTSALCYCCMFKKMNCWPLVPQVSQRIKNINKYFLPNVTAVNKIVNDNKDFQSKQKDLDTEAMIKNKRMADEIERKLRDLESFRKRQEADEMRNLQSSLKKMEDDSKKQIDMHKKSKEDDFRKKSEHIKAETKRLEILQSQMDKIRKHNEAEIENER